MKKIAIIGAGFAGMTAAFYLMQKGWQVSIFEKESQVGGLAGGFKPAKNEFCSAEWNSPLENHYHHLFTNDKEAIKLMKKVGIKYEVISPVTSIFKNSRISRFDTPLSLLKFPHLSWLEKIRVGVVLLFLKTLSLTSPTSLISPKFLESQTSYVFLSKWLGVHAFQILFKPLFVGKFGVLADKISAIWFWARIKKRTSKLIYPVGGFQTFAEKLAEEIKEKGGEFFLSSSVQKIEKENGKWAIHANQQKFIFDQILCTFPLAPPPASATPQALRAGQTLLTPLIPLFPITHLDCLTLILETKKSILQKTYWLNINEEKFPFLSVVQHTNLVNKKNYCGRHICYVGNYLPKNHGYFNLTKDELLAKFLPFIKKVNPHFKKEEIINSYLFRGVDAQPVVTTDYFEKLPPMDLAKINPKLQGLYVANMDMVYPWDRGVNYAIEIGREAAQEIRNSNDEIRNKFKIQNPSACCYLGYPVISRIRL